MATHIGLCVFFFLSLSSTGFSGVCFNSSLYLCRFVITFVLFLSSLVMFFVFRVVSFVLFWSDIGLISRPVRSCSLFFLLGSFTT